MDGPMQSPAPSSEAQENPISELEARIMGLREKTAKLEHDIRILRAQQPSVKQVSRRALALGRRIVQTSELLHFYLQAFATTVGHSVFTFCNLPNHTSTRLTFE